VKNTGFKKKKMIFQENYVMRVASGIYWMWKGRIKS